MTSKVSRKSFFEFVSKLAVKLKGFISLLSILIFDNRCAILSNKSALIQITLFALALESSQRACCEGAPHHFKERTS